MSTTVQTARDQARKPATRNRTIAVLPVILAGWLAQRRLARGLAMGSVR
jgi:ABC-type glycerol-3-phosphate transport system permease component